jgi:hypothetical protein
MRAGVSSGSGTNGPTQRDGKRPLRRHVPPPEGPWDVLFPVNRVREVKPGREIPRERPRPTPEAAGGETPHLTSIEHAHDVPERTAFA